MSRQIWGGDIGAASSSVPYEGIWRGESGDEVLTYGTQCFLCLRPFTDALMATVEDVIPKNVLGKPQVDVDGCHGRRPGPGARRRVISPIIAHLIIASECSGRRS